MGRYEPQFEIGRRESSEECKFKRLVGLNSPFLNKRALNSWRHRDSLIFSQKIARCARLRALAIVMFYQYSSSNWCIN